MKKLREYATIKNLNNAATTIIDDEGNINELDAENADYLGLGDFDDLAGDDAHALRPDGSHDGLDDIDGLDMLDDPFAGEESLDAEVAPDELGVDDEIQEPELGDEELSSDEDILGDEETEEDPDFQGVIRTVTGACLVYKRKTEDGTYEELWVYNVGKNMRNEVKIRRAVLAGTDIPPQDISSPDGTQKLDNTTIGNVQYLRITGLPN